MTRQKLGHTVLGNTALGAANSADTTSNTMVLVHGFTQTGDSWIPFLQHLAPLLPETRFIVVDLPGHGSSTAIRADLSETAELLVSTAGRATYVGYSLGARVVLHAALAHPESVVGCGLISGTAGIDDDAERAARRSSDDLLAQRIRTIGTASFIDEWLAQPLFAHLTAAQAGRAARISNTEDGLAASLQLCGTGTQLPLWHRLDTLAMPLLAIAGALDTKFVALARRMAVLAPQSRLEIIANAGHSPHLEQPAALATVLHHWMTSPRA